MLRDYYIYKVTHRITGEYYIGMRAKPIRCASGDDWYKFDDYWGSQVGWKEIKGLSKLEKSKVLYKEILSAYYQVTQKEVAIVESTLIKDCINDVLNKNYHYDYNGGFAVGSKNPSYRRKGEKYSRTSIVFYQDKPYRLNDLCKTIKVSIQKALELIQSGEIIKYSDYIKDNFFNHTKNINIFGETKTVIDWCNDERLNQTLFLKSTRLLKWYLDKYSIEYREISQEELSKIRSISNIGTKKLGTSKYQKENNSSRRPEVKLKISKANKKPKKRKICPHCNKLVGNSIYHFDNCVNKEGNKNIDRTRGHYNKKRETLECPHCKKRCLGKNKWHFEFCKLAAKIE